MMQTNNPAQLLVEQTFVNMGILSEEDISSDKKAYREADDYTAYKRFVWRQYEHAPHLGIIDAALMDAARYVETGGKEGRGRLIIEIPPRHGKTVSTSRLFPPWLLGRMPDKRIMLVSYGASLANKNSRAARNIIRSEAYRQLFNVSLANDSAAVDSWDLAGHEGGLDAFGIGGSAAGKGAHVLLIDDPIKNREEAESETHREKVWDAYQNDLYTRLEPGGIVIVIATRWHKDDLTGRLLKEEPDEWCEIRLPAIAEDDDLLGRTPGEALWPWRYPLDALERIKRSVGRYGFAALYQQRPQPREGGLFRWEDIHGHRVDTAPDLARVAVGVDPSGSARGDEVGVVTAGRTRDGHYYLLADDSLHASPDQWGRVVMATYKARKADRVVAEKNFGGDMVEHVLRTVDRHVSYKAVTASRGKELRAEPIAALYEQGLVHHVGYFDKLEDEQTTWKPGSDSPNRMDAAVWVLTELMRHANVQTGEQPDVLANWRG